MSQDFNQYSIMLVDDEEDVIQAILHKMDWEEMGYQIPSYAHNGVEALDMAEASCPDVVLTDIKMPYMDGLELSHRLKDAYPNIRIVFFSGFDEFEYAQEAIRLEAEEYILKPIEAGKLREVLSRIHAALDKEMDERQNVEKLTAYYLDSLPLLQEDFYASLAEGRMTEENLHKQMVDYRISLASHFYSMAIIHISRSDVPEGMNPVLLTVSVRRLATERMKDRWKCCFFHYQGSTVMIAQFDEREEVTAFTDECSALCRMAKNVCNANVTIGIGQVCDKILGLSVSYQGALDAVSYRALYGTTKAINIAEVEPQEDAAFSLEADKAEDHLRGIFKKIKMESRLELEKAVAGYLSAMTAEQSSIQGHRFFVIGLVGELYRFACNNHLSPEEIFSGNEDIYLKIQQMEPAELSGWLMNKCIRMQELLQEGRSDTTKSTVQKAVDYVQDHYADKDLSVDSLCSYLGLSAAYFSTVFKKETGKTFVAFLTDLRMERAVQLLIERDEKTYIIAREVGYDDPNYFSYVFKKQFGVSPSKYRQG